MGILILSKLILGLHLGEHVGTQERIQQASLQLPVSTHYVYSGVLGEGTAVKFM